MWKGVLIYGAGLFLVIYGYRSFMAGLKNENKIYWVSFGYSLGMKNLLKEKYNKYNNIFWGLISFISGIVILIGYTIQIT